MKVEEHERQTACAVMLVDPACFSFNPETAHSNCFARSPIRSEAARQARAELDGVAERLSGAGVDVHILKDSPDPVKPDAVFPNNWVSFHADGTVVTYPMAAASRRRERRIEALKQLLGAAPFGVERWIDLSSHEQEGRCLEGTGSLVLDRPRRRAYACLSDRTHVEAIADFDRRLGYSTFAFRATDRHGRAIYHSNVMMSLGRRYALVCLDCVAAEDRTRLAEDLEAGGRRLIEARSEQLAGFACNVIELESLAGEPLVALSSSALRSLRPDQRRALEELAGELVASPVPTIERIGGGSVRCMIAEIHLPRIARGPGL